MTLNVRGSNSRPRSGWRRQKSRQTESNRMLSRPVDPQPVKKRFPPLRRHFSTAAWIPAARPESANSRYLRRTSASTANNNRNPAARSPPAVSLKGAVTGWDASVRSAPSLNWALILRNSSDRSLDFLLIVID